MSSRNVLNEQHHLAQNRSKKSLGYGYSNGSGHVGVYGGQDGSLKIRNYYDMLEKNRRNEKMQNDLTKIYMVNA
jgi:hypothetical protein